jgi:hypothetical protein
MEWWLLWTRGVEMDRMGRKVWVIYWYYDDGDKQRKELFIG